MFSLCLDLFTCQENIGRREIDAADCKTVYLSEYVSFPPHIDKMSA